LGFLFWVFFFWVFWFFPKPSMRLQSEPTQGFLAWMKVWEEQVPERGLEQGLGRALDWEEEQEAQEQE
jgi:hypothetical protein